MSACLGQLGRIYGFAVLLGVQPWREQAGTRKAFDTSSISRPFTHGHECADKFPRRHYYVHDVRFRSTKASITTVPIASKYVRKRFPEAPWMVAPAPMFNQNVGLTIRLTT